jgi:hypothetical protein
MRDLKRVGVYDAILASRAISVFRDVVDLWKYLDPHLYFCMGEAIVILEDVVKILLLLFTSEDKAR